MIVKTCNEDTQRTSLIEAIRDRAVEALIRRQDSLSCELIYSRRTKLTPVEKGKLFRDIRIQMESAADFGRDETCVRISGQTRNSGFVKEATDYIKDRLKREGFAVKIDDSPYILSDGSSKLLMISWHRK